MYSKSVSPFTGAISSLDDSMVMLVGSITLNNNLAGKNGGKKEHQKSCRWLHAVRGSKTYRWTRRRYPTITADGLDDNGSVNNPLTEFAKNLYPWLIPVYINFLSTSLYFEDTWTRVSQSAPFPLSSKTFVVMVKGNKQCFRCCACPVLWVRWWNDQQVQMKIW